MGVFRLVYKKGFKEVNRDFFLLIRQVKYPRLYGSEPLIDRSLFNLVFLMKGEVRFINILIFAIPAWIAAVSISFVQNKYNSTMNLLLSPSPTGYQKSS